MRYLITGGAGFIGSHLARRLLAKRQQVIVYDNFTRPSPLHAEHPECALRVIEGDIRDAVTLRCAMRQVDVVFHLAAQSQVLAASRDPDYCFSTNVAGTVNVLGAARATGVRRVVFASSREVYGEPSHLPVDEERALKPKNDYGASKVAAEAYCRTMGDTDRLSTVMLRFSNVYGPGDADRLIPRWLARAQADADLEIYGGRQILDMVWIGTAIQALIAAAHPAVAATAVNVGAGRGSPIGDIATRILLATGSASRVVIRPARQIEVERFVADVRRMRDTLGVAAAEDPLHGIAAMLGAPRVTPIRDREEIGGAIPARPAV